MPVPFAAPRPPPLASINERDLDLMLLTAIHGSAAFRAGLVNAEARAPRLAGLPFAGIITVSVVHGMLNSDATGLVLLLLLALGLFTAGLNLWSWQICVTGAFLAVAAPALAWPEQAALLIMLLIGIVLIAVWFLYSRRGGSRSEAA